MGSNGHPVYFEIGTADANDSMAANQYHARYFIAGDPVMTSGFVGDEAFNASLRRSMAEVIAQSKLVGHFPDPYYGDLKVYELRAP
jgi:hypothetical protein